MTPSAFRFLQLALLVLSLATIASAQEEAEDKTLQTLTRLGLSRPALAYAERQRTLHRSTPSLLARWTQRLMETQAQAALRSPESMSGERGASTAWEACELTYDEFKKTHADNPRMPWLTWQLARCHFLQAQSELARYLAAPGNAEPRERALALVRTILENADELEKDVRQRQPIAARQRGDAITEAPAEQLAKLFVDAGLMRCEALLIRSRLYERGTRDRIAAATDVETQASRILAITSAEWNSRGPLLTAQATALLELGRAEDALRILTDLCSGDYSPSTRARASSTAVEYLCADGDASRARGFLAVLANATGNANQSASGDTESAGGDTENTVGASAAYSLAAMQVALAELATLSGRERDERLQQLVSLSKKIGEQHGQYWRNRAESLLTGSLNLAASNSANGESQGPSTGTANTSKATLDLMLVEVRQLLAAKDEEAAIKKLLQFRDNEAALGHSANALKLAAQAAALLQRKNEWIAAYEAVEKTAVQFASDPTAATLHARAAFMCSQALRSDIKNNQLAAEYERLLIQQLSTFPDADATNEPQTWLMQWLDGKGRRSEFTERLLDRAANCSQTDFLRETLFRWLTANLDEKLSSGSLKNEPTDLAEKLANARTVAEPLSQDKKLTIEIVELASVAFSGWPAQSVARTWDAELTRLESSASAPLDRQLLKAIRLLRLSQQEQLTPARRAAETWQPQMLPSELLSSFAPAFIDAIDEVQSNSAAGWSQALKLDEEWVKQLAASKNASRQALAFRLRIWAGEANAAEKLQQLASDESRNGQVQLQLAKAEATTGAKGLDQSTKICRQLIASSQPDSTLHLSARWQWIKNLQRAGQAAKAKQSASLALATLPSTGAEIWKTRFERAAR